MEYYLAMKRSKVLTCAVVKDHILYDSIYMKCPDRQIHRDKVCLVIV